MVKEIKPSGPVSARIRVPGSKSITNRALICSALARGESVLFNASGSDDTNLMANGLNQLGVLVRRSGDPMSRATAGLAVEGGGGNVFAPKFPIPVGNAGTTFRFLIGLAALAEGAVAFEADMRMGERPVDDLFDALRSLGIDCGKSGGFARYVVTGGTFRGGTTRLCGDKSSQFLSSLLMVAPYAKEDVSIEIEGDIVSRPYVEMTMEVMKAFGVKVEHENFKIFTIGAGQRYKPRNLHVESDATSSSYFAAAAAICGGDVTMESIPAKSWQGDVAYFDLLKEMGCEVLVGNESLTVRSRGKLKGIDVDMNGMPDIVPTVAAGALFAQGKTVIRNVAHLEHKESHRLEGLATELRKLGGRVELLHNGLEIMPSPLHGAQLDTYDDHRLAMSFALIGLRVPGVRIENPDCVRKSFPGFWREFDKLYIRSPDTQISNHNDLQSNTTPE